MDIVEFAENVCGMELYEWQKESLRRMYELSSKGRIYILPRRTGGSCIYIDDTMRKELISDGQTNVIE